MPLIDRYLARLIGRPLAMCLVLSAMLLLVDRMRRLLDFVVRSGGPIDLVWRMLANTAPGYLSYGLTIGLLLAVLLTFRRLALGAELDVLRGVGVSYFRLLRVPYLYAAVLAAANLAIVAYVQPRARFVNEQLEFDLRSGALGAVVRAEDFAPLGRGGVLRVDRVEERGHRLEGVFLRARRPNGGTVTVAARSATVLAAPDRQALVLRLRDGVLVSEAPSLPSPRVLDFVTHDLPVPLPRVGGFRRRGEGRYQELTLPELAGLGWSGPVSPSVRAHARAELHFRLAEVAAMFVLPMLALGLGVPAKRSGSALGLFLAVPLVVFWFKVNGWAADLAAAGRIDAVPALWTPFAAMAALAGWMVYRLDRTPGGQPLAVLETGWASLGGWWRRRRGR